MTKQYKRIFTGLVIAVIVAFGAYFGVLVYRNGQAKKAVEEENKKIVFDFDPSEIKEFEAVNSSGEYGLKLSVSGWEFTKGEPFKLDSTRISGIAETMSRLKATKILTEELPADLSPYGLDKPQKVIFIFKNGSRKILDIGSKVPGDSAYYVKNEDSDTIYIVSEADAQKMSVEVNSLKDRNLFNIISTDEITAFKYTDHGKLIYDLKKENNEWKMTAPFNRGSVNSAGITAVTSMIIRAESTTLLDVPADLSEYGFDKPSYEVDISTADMTLSMIFGSYYDENENYIYAYEKAANQVYVFPVASLGFPGSATEDVLNKRLHHEAFSNITEFDLDVFGTKIKVDYDYVVEEGKTSSYAVNGISVNREDDDILWTFNDFINSITGLSFENVYEDASFTTEGKEPEVKIVYSLKEGGKYTVELYAAENDKSLLQMVENGKYMDCVISRASVENGILLYYKDLMNKIK